MIDLLKRDFLPSDRESLFFWFEMGQVWMSGQKETEMWRNNSMQFENTKDKSQV